MTNLSTLYVETKQYKKAEPLFLEAIDMQLKRLGKEHPDVAYAYNNLARLYSLQNKDISALKYYQKAVSVSEKSEGADHESTQFYRRNLKRSEMNNK